jgi:diguanylate cyclase (GGDEF)-like protein
MGNATLTGKQIGDPGVSKFIVYADFNCPFCYALNERLHELNREDQVQFRAVQHAPSISSDQVSFEVLSTLSTEVAEVRRRTPSTQINVPMFRPNSGPAMQLVNAVAQEYPRKAIQLCRLIYRALWVNGDDISKPDLLDKLIKELDIDPPAAAALKDDKLAAWQTEWDGNPEFERKIPVVISDRGETVVGFPLEPEIDAFLNSGSLISDKVLNAASEQQVMQRILVLDNDLQSLQMIIEQMRGAQVEVAKDFAGLVASALNHGMPDLVLVNTALIGGIESTDWWRNSTDSDLDITVPVIFISADKTTEAEVAAFEAGAADFIAKPFHPRVLQARLNMHLQARRSQQQLNNIARVDALTSICNRREFDLRLMTEWSRGARTGKSLALLMIDVDKFKDYNDHHGHLRGDDCLVAVAQILSSCMQRTTDLIARYGGEEFVVLLPESDLEGALKVAEACHAAILDARLSHVTSNISIYVTVSIGVAAMLPIYERSNTLLIEQADIALYEAKHNGRNRVCSFTA